MPFAPNVSPQDALDADYAFGVSGVLALDVGLPIELATKAGQAGLNALRALRDAQEATRDFERAEFLKTVRAEAVKLNTKHPELAAGLMDRATALDGGPSRNPATGLQEFSGEYLPVTRWGCPSGSLCHAGLTRFPVNLDFGRFGVGAGGNGIVGGVNDADGSQNGNSIPGRNLPDDTPVFRYNDIRFNEEPKITKVPTRQELSTMPDSMLVSRFELLEGIDNAVFATAVVTPLVLLAYNKFTGAAVGLFSAVAFARFGEIHRAYGAECARRGLCGM